MRTGLSRSLELENPYHEARAIAPGTISETFEDHNMVQPVFGRAR